MPIRLEDPETIYLELYRKLNNGWIVIIGDSMAIDHIEWQVYTPNTHKNAELELIISPLRQFMIGRKRPELRNLLKLKDDPDGWDSLIAMSVTALPDGRVLIESKHFKAGTDRELYLEGFVKALTGVNE